MLLALALLMPVGADWPQWRGPRGDGTSDAANLPAAWTDSDLRWSLPLAGPSGATPALVGDRLYVTTPDAAGKLWLLAVSTAGKEQWRRELGGGNKSRGFNSRNNAASPSPIADADHVWALMGNGEFACFTNTGAEVWRRNLQTDHGAFGQDFGIGASPTLAGDRLYFACIHRRGPESYLLAIDKKTGKDIWKHERPTEARNESKDAYSTPLMVVADGKPQLVVAGADLVTGHNVETGAEMWRFGGLNPSNDQTWRVVATPAYGAGLLFVTSCKTGPLHAVKLGGKGTLKPADFAWTRERENPDVASTAVHDGRLYLLRQQGVLLCLEAATGKELWQKKLAGGVYHASPVVADGKVYCTQEEGTITVLKAGLAPEVLGVSQVPGGGIGATPVPGDGRLYFRTKSALVCVGKN